MTDNRTVSAAVLGLMLQVPGARAAVDSSFPTNAEMNSTQMAAFESARPTGPTNDSAFEPEVLSQVSGPNFCNVGRQSFVAHSDILTPPSFTAEPSSPEGRWGTQAMLTAMFGRTQIEAGPDAVFDTIVTAYSRMVSELAPSGARSEFHKNQIGVLA